MKRRQQEEIRRFLATGDNDLLSYAWEGGLVEGGRQGKNAMISALIAVEAVPGESWLLPQEASRPLMKAACKERRREQEGRSQPPAHAANVQFEVSHAHAVGLENALGSGQPTGVRRRGRCVC